MPVLCRRLSLAAALLTALVLTGCATTTTGNSGPVATRPKIVVQPTVLILDASGSMTTADAPGPRIDAAKRAADGLLDALPDDSTLALMTYGTGTGSSDAEQAAGCQDVRTLTPLGPLHRASLKQQVDSLHPSGYTPISLAMRKAVEILPNDGSKQAVVLVSDGEDTCGVPPCDTAKTLKAQHPGLTISTVGFRSDSPANTQLGCIATATGGLFVPAGNANQLAARLLATQDIDTAKSSLSPTGYRDINIGSKISDVKRAHPDFPDVSASGHTVATWKDCNFGFTDGAVDSIAPSSGGRTIDGLVPGDPVSRATELYGKPLDHTDINNGSATLTYLADKDLGTAYQMAISNAAQVQDNWAGTIKSIVLCRCLPKQASGPQIVVLRPVDKQGNTTAGWLKNTTYSWADDATGHQIDCTYGEVSKHTVTPGVFECSPSAATADACWPTASGRYALCLVDPLSHQVVLYSANFDDTPSSAPSDPSPIELVLDDGSHCRARYGGAWSRQEQNPDLVGTYGCSTNPSSFVAVWGDIQRTAAGWSVEVGGSTGPLHTQEVVTAYFVGVA
ncbi:VWA domain-containing protein [Skermania sp. ID1734]|uniref:vWA domain-containing protein n=1 Tax=Skermania sp. ID1734 TaxID=2597516 RepID=UPI00117F74F1|nr:VWA domain-containing protein [Skermania sp. ID1734]TSE00806.1 VWA domain-containing protein [Skermania sp. ID1734]